MKTTIPISLYLYRAIQAHAELIEYLEDDFLLSEMDIEEPLNTVTHYLFGMYWMSVGDQKRVNSVKQIKLSGDPAAILIDYGYEELPIDLELMSKHVMGEVFAEWYQEKSTKVIEALVEFIETVEWIYPNDLPYSELLEYLDSLLATVAVIYNIASEKPLFCQTNAIDRMFEESGLSSFYESEHQRQSRAILRFLKFWEKVDDAESRRKLLAVRSDDARIEKVKRIITKHSPSIPQIKKEAASYIALLRLGPINDDRYQYVLDEEDNLHLID